jgi:hypothetical protein
MCCFVGYVVRDCIDTLRVCDHVGAFARAIKGAQRSNESAASDEHTDWVRVMRRFLVSCLRHIAAQHAVFHRARGAAAAERGRRWV